MAHQGGAGGIKGVLRLVQKAENSICQSKTVALSEEQDNWHSGLVAFDDDLCDKDEDDAGFVPLTKEDVQRLGLDAPDGVLHKQLLWQLLTALVAIALAWLLRDAGAALAAAYGAGCSVVPAAFFVLAVQGHSGAGIGLLYFLVYEGVRLLLSLVMLVAGAYYFGSGADKAALLCMVLTYVVVLKLGWVQVVMSVLPRKL